MNLRIKNASFRVSFLKQHVCFDLKRSNVENQSSAVVEYMDCFNTVNTMFPGTGPLLIQNSIGEIWNLMYCKQCLEPGSKPYCAGCCSNKY